MTETYTNQEFTSVVAPRRKNFVFTQTPRIIPYLNQAISSTSSIIFVVRNLKFTYISGLTQVRYI
jgi:hypothetical protein